MDHLLGEEAAASTRPATARPEAIEKAENANA